MLTLMEGSMFYNLCYLMSVKASPRSLFNFAI